MLNFIKGKIQRWASNQQRDELEYFLEMLEGADLEGRALTVALATDFSNKVLDTSEFQQAREEGSITIELVRIYQKLQKSDNLPLASGVAVHIHTERAKQNLALMNDAKRMWELLAESFPIVMEIADEFELMGGNHLDLQGYNRIPEDFV